MAKMSLLDMKQAWASSRLFTKKPINRRVRKTLREEKSPTNVQIRIQDENVTPQQNTKEEK